MRASILILVFCFLQLDPQAQSYTVIHTIGKILNTSTGEYLSQGVKISETAELKFESNDARAAVLSSSRGRFIIQKQQTGGEQGDFSYALSSVISPVKGRLSTRAGGINNQMDFEKHFSEQPIVLIEGDYRTKVSPSAYPMNDSQFFYAQYSYRGETVNKKLGSSADQLIINEVEFFAIDGNPINPAEVGDITLFYYDAGKQESTQLSGAQLRVISRDDFKAITEGLSSDQEQIGEVILELYGKYSEESLMMALGKVE